MTVLTITINDQVFDKKSSEVAYLSKVLQILRSELGRGQGYRHLGNDHRNQRRGRTE